MSDKYIRVYDDVIDKDLCDKLINKFEKEKSHQENVVLEDHRSFKQTNLHAHDEWKKFRENLQGVFLEQVEKYREDCGIQDWMFPKQFALEQFRMKRYLPNDVDEFKDHVDVGNHATARRFLVFFLYLDDNEGGQTEFMDYDISVQPKAGRLLVFPPMWDYPHAGRKPIDKPKYIIGSYLHYV